MSDQEEAVFTGRRCPACHVFWEDKEEWVRDTILVGEEHRPIAWEEGSGDGDRLRRYKGLLVVQVREHIDCGGEMYSPGRVIDVVQMWVRSEP